MRRLYAHDRGKIAANRATAGERREWNRHTDRIKDERAAANRSAFTPRKASHKQGWKRAEVQPF